VQQNAFGRDEDAGAHDDPDDDGGPIEQAEFAFQTLVVFFRFFWVPSVQSISNPFLLIKFCRNKYFSRFFAHVLRYNPGK
jgi:hypothetical protein